MKFVSLKTIFEQALDEELKFQISLSDQIINSNDYSRFVEQNKKSLIFEEDRKIEMNIFITDYSYIVNNEGIVSIGGHLFQFTKKGYKILEKGNDFKLHLLKQADKDDISNNIKVFRVTQVNSNSNKKNIYRATELYARCGYPISPLGGSCDYLYYENRLNLYQYQQAIFDYNNPFYDCYIDPFGQWNCTVGYPIIGYEPYSTMEVSSRSDRFRCPFCSYCSRRDYQSWWKNIEVNYFVNGESRYWQKTQSSIYFMYETVFNIPSANITGFVNYEMETLNWVEDGYFYLHTCFIPID